jgi:cytochrome c-type biogenesis protein
MSLDLAAVPLALAAGVLGIVSPCVWPLVPVVTSSAAAGSRTGPFYLALGMSLAFAGAGTVVTLLLVSSGLDPELLRYVAAVLLTLVGLTLLVRRMSDGLTLRLAGLTAGRGGDGGAATSSGRAPSGPAQFGVGALLGVVWLPCVGPTLGAAIALASMGQSMGTAFIVMLAYGIGTAGVLLAAGLLSGSMLSRWRPQLLSGGGFGRKLLGSTLLLLGVLVLTGFDKVLETMAVGFIPAWIFTL